MFSFLRRSKDKPDHIAPEKKAAAPETDTALIAVIAAAIARFRESEGGQRSEAGFVVKRVRRI